MDDAATRRLLLERTIAARDERLAHLDALDTKAGILFGFAAATVPLSFLLPTFAILPAAGFSTTSALFAFAALRLRVVRLVDAKNLWSQHHNDALPDLELGILATTMSEIPDLDRTLRDKADRIYTAQVWLVATVAVDVIGVVIKVGSVMVQ